MRSCLQPDIQGYYVALENLLKTYLGQCFQTNFTTDKVRQTRSIRDITC